MTKEFLSDRGIPFETRDVLLNPAAKAELQALGLDVTPVTVIGDKVIIGFNAPELAAAFGIPGLESKQADPRWMLSELELLMPAVIKIARQIPDNKLEWVTPEGKGTMRNLTYHTLNRPMMALEAEKTGEHTWEEKRAVVKDALATGFKTSEEIARYGEGVLETMRWWLGGTGNCDLGKVADTYHGPQTVGFMLTLAVGHMVHHIKQLYNYLDMIGITPEDPIGEKEFAGVLVPVEY